MRCRKEQNPSDLARFKIPIVRSVGGTEHRSSTCPTAAQNAVIPEAAVREAQARELEKKRKTGTAAAAGVVAVRVVVSSSNHSSSYRNRRCVSHRTCKSNICNWRWFMYQFLY